MKVSTPTIKAVVLASSKANSKELQSSNSSTNDQTGELLIKAKNGDEEASTKLLNTFKEYIVAKARIIKSQSHKWLSHEEIESDGMLGLVKAILKYDPAIHRNPYQYTLAAIRNTMIDYVKLESPVHQPFSAQLTGKNGDDRIPEGMIADPYAEDLNKSINSPDIEDLRILLQSNQAKKILSDSRKRTVLELSLGIDLGSNPTCKKEHYEEIAKIIGTSLGNTYMIRTRVIRELQALAKILLPKSNFI